MKKEKQIARFESIAHCAVSKDVDKYLAKASLDNIKSLLPTNIDFDKNYDLLPWAANGSVVNKGNKNNHVIDTVTAVAATPTFMYKSVNLEHQRPNVVGTILSTGFTNYGSNEIITPDQALIKGTEPFNMAFGGIVYRVANQDFANLLEKSSDPESLLYQSISCSWEICFFNYFIAIGSANLSEAEIVSDENQVKELSKFLKAKGGSNKLDDGTPIYQYIQGSTESDEQPLGLAFAFVTKPAADVKGVVTASIDDKTLEIEKNLQKSEEILKKPETIEIKRVTYNSMKTIKNLDELYNLSEADFKEGQVSLASAFDVIKNGIKEANDKYLKEVEARKADQVSAKELSELKETVKEMAAAQAKAESNDTFNSRMSLLDSEFNLDADARKAIASEISKLDTEDSFKSWYGNFSIFAAAKKKDAKNAKDQKDAKDAKNVDSKDAKDSKADDDADDATAKEVKARLEKVEQALASATTKDGTGLNLGVDFSKTYTEKYAGAFSKDGVSFKK